jgi:hypothetical protein
MTGSMSMTSKVAFMRPLDYVPIDRGETRPELTYRGMIFGRADADGLHLVVASDPSGTRRLPDHADFANGEFRHNWGYGGDGPHYTAYCILFDLFGRAIPGLRGFANDSNAYKDPAVTTFVDAFLTERALDDQFELEARTILRLYGQPQRTPEADRSGWPQMGTGHVRLLEAMIDTEGRWSHEQIAELARLSPKVAYRYRSELYDFFDCARDRLCLVADRRRKN